MPRSIIIPDVERLTDHYLRQQRGRNIAGFRGTRMQRGYGLGSIFKSLARFTMPLFKKSAESVGKQALKISKNHVEEKFLKTWQINKQMLYYIRLEEERRED